MTRKHLLGVGLAVLLVMVALRAEHLQAIAAAPAADVLIAYDSATASNPSSALHTWEPVLRRSSVPHRWVALRDFGVLDGGRLAHRFAAIVVPRRITGLLTDATRAQFARFVNAGGSLVISSNPVDVKAAAERRHVLTQL
jgi:hypothetical protein